ncbi:Protein downstream neighbor of Son [Senna tora]|uniref:Protein downstream neighbor of Son n=1 Tax=Senna tora TaxID=362788 RepID=A0A834TCK4_9FABA|nr:Protein downstream neighbor of Son [Senna tora]
MAKVVAPSSLRSNSRRLGPGPLNGSSIVKRKTPSELRGEQLKRANAVGFTDESPSPLSGSTNLSEVDHGLKRPGLSRNPRYTVTRVDEVFPAKKSRFRVLSGKENAKENPSVEQTSNLKNISLFSNSAAKRQQGISRLENSVASTEVSKDGVLQTRQTIQKCSQGKFLSVTDLSSAADRSSGLAAIDLGEALKGLATLEPRVGSHSSSERCGDSTSNNTGNFFSEYQIPGQKAPLDLTLKTSMRVVLSSPVNGTMPQFTLQPSPFKGQNISVQSQLSSSFQGFKALHSWTYPQSVLPPSVISVFSTLTTEGELEFLRKRQEAWEESFRNLYYMLRNNFCGIFYVCTSQFVVMFTGGDGSGKCKCLSNAYISQSTRGLRSLLREHDICFSMPLCHSKVEQVTTEDLVELSEIEKHNLGQTRRSSTFSDVDNSPESLLVISGNKNAHGLYDLLLNYRSFLTSLSGMDVPVLLSPVPFQNAALSSPEIKCMEMRRAEQIAAACDGSIRKGDESAQGLPGGLCSSIEIKEAFLPPWIICGICALVGSEGRNFEASFVTEPSSIGLNIAFKSTCEKTGSRAAASESLQNSSDSFGISEATVTSCLWSCSLKGLKYNNGSYTASLSPV